MQEHLCVYGFIVDRNGKELKHSLAKNAKNAREAKKFTVTADFSILGDLGDLCERHFLTSTMPV